MPLPASPPLLALPPCRAAARMSRIAAASTTATSTRRWLAGTTRGRICRPGSVPSLPTTRGVQAAAGLNKSVLLGVGAARFVAYTSSSSSLLTGTKTNTAVRLPTTRVLPPATSMTALQTAAASTSAAPTVADPDMYTTSFAFFEALWEAGITHCFVNLGSDHPSIIEAMVRGQKEKKDNFPKIITCPNEVCPVLRVDYITCQTNQMFFFFYFGPLFFVRFPQLTPRV